MLMYQEQDLQMDMLPQMRSPIRESSVMASSVAEKPTDTVASGSVVTVNPVSGSAVSGETGISYTSVVAVKQKDGSNITLEF